MWFTLGTCLASEALRATERDDCASMATNRRSRMPSSVAANRARTTYKIWIYGFEQKTTTTTYNAKHLNHNPYITKRKEKKERKIAE